jgi:hypothetical protein
MTLTYFNRDGTPFIGDATEWACSLKDQDLLVAFSRIVDTGQDVVVDVSTVFVGIGFVPVPLLFASTAICVRTGRWHRHLRYSTEARAVVGHRALVSVIVARTPTAVIIERIMD